MTERVTLITGASAGIGTELARVFASHGHRLALVARRADRLTTLADEIASAGGAAPIVIPCDLEQPDAGDKIAAALANNPDVLVADEPTGELDGKTEADVLRLIRDQADRGTAVIVASHSAAVAAMADEVIQLKDGQRQT